jgi:hypothetical protein
MIYINLDGDDIGLNIEKSFLENDEVSLKTINENIKQIVEIISLYLIKKGFKIIFSGADGIIGKGDKSISKNVLVVYTTKTDEFKVLRFENVL